MPTFQRRPTADLLNAGSHGTIIAQLGIEFVEVGEDYVVGKMPVDARTRQPYGILHGGASVVLAETLGSVAASCMLPDDEMVAVGLEINASHLRSVASGYVTGRATPIRVGRSNQVWQIDLTDDRGRPTCACRLTLAVVQNRGKAARPL